MKPLEYGTVGAGFVGPHHIDAVRRLRFVEITALASSKFETAQRKAARLFVPRSYGSRSCRLAAPGNHENDPSPALVPRAPSPQGSPSRRLCRIERG
jgi:hypothetical protein